MPKKESGRKIDAGKVDLRLAVIKLAEAIQHLSVTIATGVQSAERMVAVDDCLDEAIELAGGKQDESDTPIDDSTSGSSGPRGE